MVIRDRNDVSGYAFADRLDAARWAWEFLRRNPVYQEEWRQFDGVWRALEADYGRPPDRDFCAWKRDPRAWVAAADCAEADCRVDQDKVLIECAMGARWGFYKFPPDPADEDPVGGERLVWRPLDEAVKRVRIEDTDWLGDDPARVAFGFDLALPLRDQIERAKRALQGLQRERQRNGTVHPRSIATLRDSLKRMLRLLDADAAGDGPSRLAAIDPQWRELLREAVRLRDGGYRQLAWLPT